MSDEIKIIDVG